MDKQLLSSLLVESHSGDYRNIAKTIAGFLKSRTRAKIILQKLSRKKSNIIAIFGNPSFLINCHMDTVPPSGNWGSNPYSLTEKGNKLIGLGVADTKSNIYAVLKAVEAAKPKNLMLLFSVDEEAEFPTGVNSFLCSPYANQIRYSIVCEPTNIVPVWRHKGYSVLEFKVLSAPSHSSNHSPGMSAIARASKLIGILDSKGFNIGTISGGTAHNINASQCAFSASLRSFMDKKSIVKQARECIIESGVPAVSFKLKYNEPCLEGKSFKEMRSVLGALVSNPAEASFWSEASLFEKKGKSAMVFGAGSIAQAHSSNEYVLTSQIKKAQIFFEKVINKACK